MKRCSLLTGDRQGLPASRSRLSRIHLPSSGDPDHYGDTVLSTELRSPAVRGFRPYAPFVLNSTIGTNRAIESGRLEWPLGRVKMDQTCASSRQPCHDRVPSVARLRRSCWRRATPGVDESQRGESRAETSERVS